MYNKDRFIELISLMFIDIIGVVVMFAYAIMHSSISLFIIGVAALMLFIGVVIGIIKDRTDTPQESMQLTRYTLKQKIRGGKIGEAVLHHFLKQVINEKDGLKSSKKFHRYFKVMHIFMRPMSVEEIQNLMNKENTL